MQKEITIQKKNENVFQLTAFMQNIVECLNL